MSIDSINTTRGYERDADVDTTPSAHETAPNDTADGGDSITSLLVGGDIGAQIAAMVIMQAKGQREIHGEIELAENNALDRVQEAQVQALHDKADNTRWAAFVEGGFTMASGVAAYTGSDAEAALKGRYDGVATGAKVGATVFGGHFKANADDCDADAKQHEYEASRHQRTAKSADDAVRENQKLLERALDFYKQTQQGAAETTRTSVGTG